MIISLLISVGISIVIALFSGVLWRTAGYAILVGALAYGGCRIKQAMHTDQPDSITATIASVTSGNQIEIQAGLLGRKTRTVTLYGITIPSPQETQAKDNLTKLLPVKSQARIEIIDGHKLITDITGIIYTGDKNINTDQLTKGLAQNTSGRKDFYYAEKEAKKNKIGIWHEEKETKKHWWGEAE